MGLVDGRQRRTPVHRAEPAGVAVGEHVDAVLARLPCSPDQLHAVLADGLADRHVLVGDQGGFGVGGGAAISGRKRREPPAQAFDRPAQVHRGRPRGQQQGAGALQSLVAGVLPRGERHAVAGRRPDQGRPPDGHVRDRPGHGLGACDSQGLESMRQHPLVDHQDVAAVMVQPDGPKIAAVDAHGRDLARWARRSQALERLGRAGTELGVRMIGLLVLDHAQQARARACDGQDRADGQADALAIFAEQGEADRDQHGA